MLHAFGNMLKEVSSRSVRNFYADKSARFRAALLVYNDDQIIDAKNTANSDKVKAVENAQEALKIEIGSLSPKQQATIYKKAYGYLVEERQSTRYRK